MNSTQVTIAVLWSAAALAALAFGLHVIRSAFHPVGVANIDEEALERGERRWFGVIAGLLLLLLVATLSAMPYLQEVKAGDRKVFITGQQFAWTIKPASVKAGEAIEFNIRSKDVAHGVGFYKGTKLAFQVQASPGYVQKYVYTFDKPGKYELLCLEFCGSGHHLMAGKLEVKP